MAFFVDRRSVPDFLNSAPSDAPPDELYLDLDYLAEVAREETEDDLDYPAETCEIRMC